MSSIVPCYVCGGTDYEKKSGCYICRNCDTQSQDIVEQSFEHVTDAAYPVNAESEKEEIKSLKVDFERKWTSWESYNMILRHLVDELIELGAQSRLRKTAFQLWALYLRTERIAFFSHTPDRLPSLPVHFKNRDIEVLYGIRSFRKLYLKDIKFMKRRGGEGPRRPIVSRSEIKSDEEPSDVRVLTCTRNDLRKKQHKLAKASLGNNPPQNQVKESHSDTETLASVSSSKPETKEVGILFRNSACKHMTELKRKFKETKQRYGGIEKIPRNLQSWFASRVYSKNKTSHKETLKIPLSMNAILIILRLALMLIEDSIQWADLLRWIVEGRLSFFRAREFLQANAKILAADTHIATRSNLVHVEMRRMATLLKLEDIPSPNMLALIERYAYELCLPREFIEFIKKLMALFPSRMDYANYGHRIFPDHEGRAMSHILFAFKLLFSLDDLTEGKLSEFADTVNKNNAETPADEVSSPLFSWNEWFRFIKCRRVILSKFDFNINSLYENEVNLADDAFLERWDNAPPETGCTKLRDRIDHSLLSQLEMTAQRLEGDQKVRRMNFPPSTTPFQTNIQHLMTAHRGLISNRCYSILSTDFSSYSIRYLLDPAWAADIGKKLGIDAIPVFETATEAKLFEKKREDVPRGSKNRVIPGFIPLPVHVEDHRKRNTIEKSSDEFYPDFKCFVGNSREKKETESDFKLYYPASEYWLFHEQLGKMPVTERFCEDARRLLPTSFIWLLKECARIIRSDVQDLYDELVTLEYVYTSLFSDDHEYAYKAPFYSFSNEW